MFKEPLTQRVQGGRREGAWDGEEQVVRGLRLPCRLEACNPACEGIPAGTDMVSAVSGRPTG